MFISDIVKDVPEELRLYADDCVLYAEVKSELDQVELNGSFMMFHNWCMKWQKEVYFTECAALSFANKNPRTFPYNADSNVINRADGYKYLGVHISSDLKWKTHINLVSSKAIKELGYLRRTLRLTSMDTKLLTYKTLVRPILGYASVV